MKKAGTFLACCSGAVHVLDLPRWVVTLFHEPSRLTINSSASSLYLRSVGENMEAGLYI